VEAGLLRDLCGLTMREIGSSTGRGESRASRMCRRHRDRLIEDGEYATLVTEIARAALRTTRPSVPGSVGHGLLSTESAKASEAGQRANRDNHDPAKVGRVGT